MNNLQVFTAGYIAGGCAAIVFVIIVSLWLMLYFCSHAEQGPEQ